MIFHDYPALGSHRKSPVVSNMVVCTVSDLRDLGGVTSYPLPTLSAGWKSLVFPNKNWLQDGSVIRNFHPWENKSPACLRSPQNLRCSLHLARTRNRSSYALSPRRAGCPAVPSPLSKPSWQRAFGESFVGRPTLLTFLQTAPLTWGGIWESHTPSPEGPRAAFSMIALFIFPR